MNDINCWQPQIMKTLCGHLALFEADRAEIEAGRQGRQGRQTEQTDRADTHAHTHAVDSL